MRVFVLCAVLAVAVACARGDEIAAKEAVVRDLFREMLHIEPPARNSRLVSKPLTAPKHMLELYHKYSSKHSADSAATTIRNLLPLVDFTLGSVGSKDLLFNVSCVQDMEEVMLAQLQLNRRRLHQRHQHKRLLAPPYRVKLYQATPTRLVPLASVPVSMVQRSAWGSVDITVALKELLLEPRVSRRLLVVRFESPTGKLIPPSHFLRGVPDTPHAFLVVFTEDSEENLVSEDGSQPAPRPPVHTHAMVQKIQQSPHAALFFGDNNNNNNDPQLIPFLGEDRKARVFTKNNTKTVPPNDSTDMTKREFSSSELTRRVRSILDNQLPDDDDVLLDNTQVTNSVLARNDIVRYSKSTTKKLKKEKKFKRKKGKKQKHLPTFVSRQNEYQAADKESTGPAVAAGECTLRKLTVNFTELGWDDWIVAPPTIDTNYCTGSCRLPVKKALNATNHAILQSLINSLGRHPSVPAPACVPDKLSTISLLFMESTNVVAFRNYPSMIVKSCACR